MLLRCLFSAEARHEFRTYRENARRGTKIYDAVCAIIGLCLIGVLCYALCKAIPIFYDQFTGGGTDG